VFGPRNVELAPPQPAPEPARIEEPMTSTRPPSATTTIPSDSAETPATSGPANDEEPATP